jgi:ribosomal protein S12 methylthiotransferase accessory factor
VPELAGDTRFRYRFGSIVERHYGLVDKVRFLPIQIGEPEIEVASATLGNISMTLPYTGAIPGRGGAGSDVDQEQAWIRAVVEAAERYASMVYEERDFVVSTARDLGDDALDLKKIPRCSLLEYMDPRCPVVSPCEDVPIRWVRGYSLVDQRERLVPAVMTHLHFQPWNSERFWLQISTGVAAHTSLYAALEAAICENIERDAIALVWLGRLSLPRIERPIPPPVLASATLERVDASYLRYYDFDATTDLGIPTVFSVQVAEGHPYCELSVSCAAALRPEDAYVKAIREASAARAMMNRPREIPSRVIDFHELTHGAYYYGAGGHRTDFDFLLRSGGGTTTLAEMGVQTRNWCDKDDHDRLAHLVAQLQKLGLDPIAVDLTTDELREVGLWVVRVIIPQVMPISFVHRARYLGTPRLYDYVRRIKLCEFTEAEVNPGPLPFA